MDPAAPTNAAPAADRALVADVLAGRAGAFERLVREHQGLCWHVVQRMVRHPEDTRELCQETFLRVHRSLHQYRFDAPLKAWIAQVAFSIARRHLERRRIPLAEPSAADADALAPAERVAGPADVQAEAEAQERERWLHAAIDALPPLQRTLLTLYHLDELSIPEIATMTGIQEGTIKSHLFRSRQRLRAWLAPRIGEVA